MTAKLGFATALSRQAATCRSDNFQLDHWIEPALRQRVASQYSPDCQQTTPRNPVTIDRFHRVLGARRHIPASGQEHGRDRPFVCSKYEQRNGLENLTHPVLNSPVIPRFSTPASLLLNLSVISEERSDDESGFPRSREKPRSLALLGITTMNYFVRLSTDFRITSKARPISSPNSANSSLSTDFLGLTTTSTGSETAGQCKRTDSRNRRFMRLRSTAPPSTRPTVNPMRRPSPCSRRR